MRKVAAIDIGTNSVLYSLFAVIGRSELKEIHFERHSPRIGSLLKGSKKPRINDNNYRQLRTILKGHIRHAQSQDTEDILLAATNPLRLAENGKEIQHRLETDLGYPTSILSPDEEARLSVVGAVGRLRRNQTALIIDLGGGSTELVVYRVDKRLAFVSLPEGAVSLTERFKTSDKIDPNDIPIIRRELSRFGKRLTKIRPYLKSAVTLVGGTSSALAFLKDGSFLERGKEVDLSADNLDFFVRLLAGLDLPCRRQLLSLDEKRAEIIFAGVLWLSCLFNILDLKKAAATPRGLRHGLAVDWLSRR